MKTLFLDCETRSGVNIATGPHRYAEAGGEIILLAYAYDDEPVEILDVANGQTPPLDLMLDFNDPEVLKIAHNAAFERCMLRTQYAGAFNAEEWLCTMVLCYYNGLPGRLDTACRVLGLPGKPDAAQTRKLMKRFSIDHLPCGGPDWEGYKEYCINDVEIERQLYKALAPMPAGEWDLWNIDQEINDRGFLIDAPFVRAAAEVAVMSQGLVMTRLKALTGLENPRSVAQLKGWLGIVGSMNKAAVAELLKTATGVQAEVLQLRQRLGKTSISKFQNLLDSTCSDGRVRGTMQFYGAGTGRWAGRRFQPHNLPREKPVDVVFAKKLIMEKDLEDIELFYGPVEHCLSSMLRSALIAPNGKTLGIDDFGQIEARVGAWLAGEKWIMDVFRANGPYYETTASKMFRVPLGKVTKELRQKGKTAALALQYQGSIGALNRMGGMPGSTEQQMYDFVEAWRAICPAITAFWVQLNNAAVSCVAGGADVQAGKINFRFDGDHMYTDLPAGRSLFYRGARISTSPKTNTPSVAVKIVNKGAVIDKHLYGGLIFENLCQAIARDILAAQLPGCRKTCVLHVHDEIVLENARVNLITPDWCSDLPLTLDGFESGYYSKS